MMVLDRHQHFKLRTIESLSRLSLVPLWHRRGRTHPNVPYPNVTELNMLLKEPPECCCFFYTLLEKMSEWIFYVSNSGTADQRRIIATWLRIASVDRRWKVSTKSSDASTERHHCNSFNWCFQGFFSLPESWRLVELHHFLSHSFQKSISSEFPRSERRPSFAPLLTPIS